MNKRNVNLSNLPAGWVSIQLGDVVKFEYGKGLVKNKRDPNGEYVVYGANGPVGSHSEYWVKTPCLVVGRKGSAGEVHISKKPCWPIDTTYYVVPPGGILLSFLFFLLKTLNLSSFDKSTAIPGLNRNDAYVLKICLAPFPEQYRIVAKIEELFTKLDTGKEELLQAKARLKRYRQSVLKAAMDGKLTEEWRKKQGDEIESASILLDRILKERQEKWEAEQLEQMRAKGKTPPKNWRDKYKELLGPDTSQLSDLPEGWVWTTVGIVGESIKNGIYKPKHFYTDDGIACLRMYNIEDGSIVWKDIKRMNLTKEEIKKYKLIPGDILVNRVNSRELVGKAAPIPYGFKPCVYESKNMRLRLFAKHINFKYVGFWFRFFSQKYFSRNAQQTVGMASINQQQLSAMVLPLPPLSEQQAIVEEVERCFSIADEVEATLDAELKRSDALRQSILKQAFSGKLVPQDPNDEPASVLLERIKEDKMKRETEQKSKRKPKKTRIREQGLTKINDLLVGKTQYTTIYDTLKSVGQPLSPNELLKLSKLDVDEFYAQLKAEIESGRIAERRSDKTTVFLEGKNEA